MMTMIVSVNPVDSERFEVPCHVKTFQGKVVMEFPNLVLREFTLLPGQARELAAGLKHYAEEAERWGK